jgi:hypothetical protein
MNVSTKLKVRQILESKVSFTRPIKPVRYRTPLRFLITKFDGRKLSDFSQQLVFNLMMNDRYSMTKQRSV